MDDVTHAAGSAEPEVEHVTAGRLCWCEPALYGLCPMCDGCDDGCWYCDGAAPTKGLVPVPLDYPGPTITVHNDR